MTMASKILLPLLVLAAASPAALGAFDVSQMLGDKAQYKSFLKVLQVTKVAEEVNKLKSVSLLVLPDKAMKPLDALPVDKQRLVASNHVLLKYFDPIQLGEMKEKTTMLPTLLSITDKKLGIVNYTKADDGQMYFGAPGAACLSKLVKVVAARPYSISIMEVTEAILPPGLVGPAMGGRRSRGGKKGKGVKLLSVDGEGEEKKVEKEKWARDPEEVKKAEAAEKEIKLIGEESKEATEQVNEAEAAPWNPPNPM